MTDELIDVFNISALKLINRYIIEFGIFQEDGTKIVEVNILNTDDTKTKIEMQIADIIYFTEKGTITIPGKYILEKALNYSNFQLNIFLDNLLNRIIYENIDETSIDNEFNKFAIEFENYVKNLFLSTIQQTNVLGALIDQKDENKYLYDLNKLSKYIKCKIVKI